MDDHEAEMAFWNMLSDGMALTGAETVGELSRAAKASGAADMNSSIEQVLGLAEQQFELPFGDGAY